MSNTSKPSNKLVSVIVPLYNEKDNLRPFYDELLTILAKLPYDFEILFVDDGSKDGSGREVQKIVEKTKKVHLIQLARNFGKEAAVSAGLDRAKGDAAIIIDADLQMPPALIPEFIDKWEGGSEVVVGIFASRNMSSVRKYGAKLFYAVMHKISHVKITPHATDYRLLDRQVIDAFNALTERNRITRGLIDWMGFERAYIHFQQRERLSGEPSYDMKKLITLAFNSLTAYSFVPLKLAGYLGVMIIVLTIPTTFALYVMRFVLDNPYNWTINSTTFLAMLILFLVGIVLICLGLIAMYIAHIHTEVLSRPLYIVRKNPKRSDLVSERKTQKK